MVSSIHDGAFVSSNDRGPDLSTSNAMSQTRCMQFMIESALEDARDLKWTFLVYLLGMALIELKKPTDFKQWSDDLKAEKRARELIAPQDSQTTA